MTPGGMPVRGPRSGGSTVTPHTAPVLADSEVETVTLVGVDGDNALIRRKGRLYMLGLGVGCLGALACARGDDFVLEATGGDDDAFFFGVVFEEFFTFGESNVGHDKKR